MSGLWSREIRNVLAHSTGELSIEELLHFAFEHNELNHQIQSKIIQEMQRAYENTSLTNVENPFYAENSSVSDVQKLLPKELFENLYSIKTRLGNTPSGRDNSADFGFYQNQYASLAENAETVDKNELEILSRNLKRDLQKSLEERYVSWQLEQIDAMRANYLDGLYERIKKFKRLESTLSPFIKNFGRLWDMSSGNFSDYGFEILKDFSDLLENDEGLKELSDMIGRQNIEKERYEKELRQRVENKTEFIPKRAYRGQISGLRLSGDISAALPSELALYNTPATRMYFAQKLVEQKILSYSYINRRRESKTETKNEEVEVKVSQKEQKGPVIICVDTSGSMSGAPERVAKTITFALSKKCLEEDRGCYLISFSTKIEVQDLSDLKNASAIGELVKFLRKSFKGGTDATPALEHSLKLLGKNGWKSADVLMVSDFVMDSLSDNLCNSIKEKQKEKTKFYSLVIGASGNPCTIECFGENWSYNTKRRNEDRHIVRLLHDKGLN